MDSIVRQSIHQFGADRDVFAPRFCKNIVNTFQNLFKCPPEQKVIVFFSWLVIDRYEYEYSVFKFKLGK